MVLISHMYDLMHARSQNKGTTQPPIADRISLMQFNLCNFSRSPLPQRFKVTTLARYAKRKSVCPTHTTVVWKGPIGGPHGHLV